MCPNKSQKEAYPTLHLLGRFVQKWQIGPSRAHLTPANHKLTTHNSIFYYSCFFFSPINCVNKNGEKIINNKENICCFFFFFF